MNIDKDRLIQDFKNQFKNWGKTRYSLFLSLIIGLLSITLWVALSLNGPNAVMNSFEIATASFIISFIAGITIFIYLILLGQGKKIGYCWGLIGSVMWGINAIYAALWLQIILQFFIFLPLQVYGIYQWIFIGNVDLSKSGETRNLDFKKQIISLVTLFLIAFSLFWVIRYIPGEGVVYDYGVIIKDPDFVVVFFDAIVLVLAVFTTVLMLRNYSQTWKFWVITYVFWIFLFSWSAFANNNPELYASVFSLFIYLINAFIVWFNVSLKEYLSIYGIKKIRKSKRIGERKILLSTNGYAAVFEKETKLFFSKIQLRKKLKK